MPDVFAMVIAIVALSIAGSVARDYLRTQRKVRENAGDADELDRELAALRSRVEVLEEIVTDEGYTLRKELKQL